MKPFRIEERPGQLLVFSGNTRLSPHNFGRFLDLWAQRLDSQRRFGVTLVVEAHEHGDETHSDDETPETDEVKTSRLLSDFRREHRERANLLTTGFARVFESTLDSDKEAADYAEHTCRFAHYSFGVRGRDFASLDKALGWLESLSAEVPLNISTTSPKTTSEIGFYYGSTTGTTQLVAEKMQRFAALAGIALSPVNIADLNAPKELLEHDQLILGIPTWNVGELQDDWLLLFPQLDSLDFTGKQIALFGVGDQVGYPDNFLDAVGTLGKKLRERRAELVGYWSAKDYDFSASQALEGEQFMGLGIDEYNQEDKTDNRIARWLGQIYREFEEASIRQTVQTKITQSELTQSELTQSNLQHDSARVVESSY